ncbi:MULTISPECIES: colicin release lysis protein [Klebsiella pneumoniae complex]|uniref:colicin release lysis protein n=1 Tax=Klebsiella pneumoniae complex TaxID=3390273 RepID=UPI000907F008|nr:MULTISPECIES: colicin release lysis protein [Klebsiella]HBR1319349.1 colicin release lysis protein [Klebsiella quasipneumoniae subsp. quasipneumoniae]MDZ3370441.1 colicin release lysis protein [Klebsiella pneumoniae]PLC84182.1 lysis protein [Klebsiella pneumoniae]RLK97781.1 lysis protein [Klebsiella pneumoniae]UNM49269.1 lysis protein [Klebsiella pneumoniae]
MKKLLFLGGVTVSVVLAACQVNNVRDTGGGAVSPSSTVTGVTLDSGTNSNP